MVALIQRKKDFLESMKEFRIPPAEKTREGGQDLKSPSTPQPHEKEEVLFLDFEATEPGASNPLDDAWEDADSPEAAVDTYPSRPLLPGNVQLPGEEGSRNIWGAAVRRELQLSSHDLNALS